MNELIYILLPVHNRREVTKKFIDCLLEQTYKNYHLLLIDDGSTDGTEEMVRENIVHLTVLKGKGNWWWAGSIQQGIDWLKKVICSKNSIVLLINDDVTFGPVFLENAVSIMKGKKKTLLLAQIYDKLSGKLVESGVKSDLNRQQFEIANSPEEINCLSTRGLFLRLADIIEIGGFYPYLLPHYGSDYEFTIRAHRKSFRLCTSSDIPICPDTNQTGIHIVSANKFSEYISKIFSKKFVDNPFYRSIFIFLTADKMYIPRLVIVVWVKTFVQVFNRLFYSQRKI